MGMSYAEACDRGYTGPPPGFRARNRNRYSCSDGFCGATDCTRCYGSSADGEDDSERPWLADSGYDFDGETWAKVVTIRVHTARRDHKDGKVVKGQRYQVATSRTIDDDTGLSRLSHRKRVIQAPLVSA